MWGQITTHVALQGGALTQHKRHFVLTGIFLTPVVLSEGSPFFFKKKKKKKATDARETIDCTH